MTVTEPLRIDPKRASAVDMLVKVWPIILAIISVVAGWTTFDARVSALERDAPAVTRQIEKIDTQRESARIELRDDLENIRLALGKQQLTLARICVLVSKGKDCE